MQSIVFCNNKGGVGKTSLVYHLGWIFATELNTSVLLVDLDPQANLTAICLTDDVMQTLFDTPDPSRQTVWGALQPLVKGTGLPNLSTCQKLHEQLFLLPGDLSLSRFEDQLSEAWPKCLAADERSFRIELGFYHLIEQALGQTAADLVLIDVGPNLGAINRAALIASQCVVLPVAPDLFSIRGMENLGPTIHEWRQGWKQRVRELCRKRLQPDFALPPDSPIMDPVGYIIMNPSIRGDQPAKAYVNWMKKIPEVYGQYLNPSSTLADELSVTGDPSCLATMRHYQSLMPLAMQHHKPMFQLTVADGAIGAHIYAVQRCREEFKALAQKLRSALPLTIELDLL